MTHKAPKTDKINPARRKALLDGLRSVAGVSLISLGLVSYQKQSQALPAEAIRPPGAGPEKDFLSQCIRCGLCARDCPYDILEMAQLGDPVAMGTPYFIARKAPCEMCDDIPCVVACPTAALDHSLTDINDSRMGLAVLVDQEECIAFQGLRCEVCFNVCPVRGKAITLDFNHNERSGKHATFIPIVHSDACTGCGKCERACILEEAAIKVIPHKLAKGQIGEHYRLGWEEKGGKGKSLVTPDVLHEYNLPEGVEYDHTGEGLIMPETSDATPYSNNPLDTLNRKGGI